MEECYILEHLVIQGLIPSANLGISFLTKHNLKLICTEEEVPLLPVKDRSASKVHLVDRGGHSFISQRSGKVVWRIPREKVSIKAVSERTEISDKTIPGLVLPEIVYNIKKKLGCIFVENHHRASDVMLCDAR